MQSLEQIQAHLERIDQLLAQAQAGAGSAALSLASTVVWRPGDVTHGNVYATWPEVVNAVARIAGYVTIALDTDLAAANIPVGAWDFRPPGVSGPVFMVNGGKASSFTAPFATILAGATTIHGLSGLDDTSIVNNSTVAVITRSTNGGAFEMRGRATIFQSGTLPFLSVTGARTLLVLDDLASVSALGGTGAISVTAPGVIDFVLDDDSFFDVNQLTAAAAALVSGAVDFNATYSSQAVTAPLVVPSKSLQRGSVAIDGATGKSANVTAILTANSRIECTQRIPVGDNTTVRYAALNADRVLGALGTFKISALTAAGAGAVNAGDSSTVDWLVVN